MRRRGRLIMASSRVVQAKLAGGFWSKLLASRTRRNSRGPPYSHLMWARNERCFRARAFMYSGRYIYEGP
jgi:hypothetical protein